MFKMFRMRESMLRSGGNRIGSMTMVAGLVAFFIQPVPTADALQLLAVGTVIYFASAFEWRETETDIADEHSSRR